MHLRIHLHRFSTSIFLLPLVLLGAWLLAPGSQAQSGRCYVNAAATGGVHDGATWATAYLTLQDALADSGCTEIWVAAGVYYPDEGSGQTDNDRASTFALKSGVAIYGGFAGTETQLSQRAPTINITVLSGDIDQNDVTNADGVVTDAANINGANAHHVVTGSGTDSSAVLGTASPSPRARPTAAARPTTAAACTTTPAAPPWPTSPSPAIRPPTATAAGCTTTTAATSR